MELPDSSANAERPQNVGDAIGSQSATERIAEAGEGLSLEEHYKLDRRRLGQWGTRYPNRAWLQIGVEFVYLIVVLIGCGGLLIWIGFEVAPPPSAEARAFTILGFPFEYPRDRNFLLWISVGLSGVIGGACFALKWLYHSVAKWEWNRDRILWRFIVPVLSGMVAVFASLLVASGVIALLDSRFFAGFYGAVGAGWLVGYFSDSVLAALQRLAHKWFGTVDEPREKRRRQAGDQLTRE